MHGLINRSIQAFLADTYGESFWAGVAGAAGLDPAGFEAMLDYDDALTVGVLDAAAQRLERPREALLEDLGTYLVWHPSRDRLRRLLRFGGVGFVDFLHSLDDLPGRARLALPELRLPALTLEAAGAGRFTLACQAPLPGTAHVLIGLLRAMADDYGALVLIEPLAPGPGAERVSIQLLETRFASGRRFDLASPAE